jgi:hypothetical protein
MVQIKIKALKGSAESMESLEVRRSNTVAQLKEKIAETPLGAATRLIFQGKVLKDEDSLSTYNCELGCGSLIMLSQWWR